MNPAGLGPEDLRLADLIGVLTEARRQGGMPDVEALAGENPDLADELRGLWAAALIAEELASPSITIAHPGDLPTEVPGEGTEPINAARRYGSVPNSRSRSSDAGCHRCRWRWRRTAAASRGSRSTARRKSAQAAVGSSAWAARARLK